MNPNLAKKTIPEIAKHLIKLQGFKIEVRGAAVTEKHGLTERNRHGKFCRNQVTEMEQSVAKEPKRRLFPSFHYLDT